MPASDFITTESRSVTNNGWIDFTILLERTLAALERIADALEHEDQRRQQQERDKIAYTTAALHDLERIARQYDQASESAVRAYAPDHLNDDPENTLYDIGARTTASE